MADPYLVRVPILATLNPESSVCVDGWTPLPFHEENDWLYSSFSLAGMPSDVEPAPIRLLLRPQECPRVLLGQEVS